MRVIGLAGWSGAGKTTLLLRLIPELTARGLVVSTMKHAHHAFDIDQPGKDTFEHRMAGAREVLIASGRRWALMHELRDEPEPALPDLLRTLSPVDLVVIEGFKAWSHPKIWVHRVGNGKPLIETSLAGLRGIATDAEKLAAPVAVVPLDDVAGIADLALEAAEPISEVLHSLVQARRVRDPMPDRSARGHGTG